MTPVWIKFLPLLFVLEWPVICLIAAWTSGWRVLAREYRFNARFEGKCFRFVTGKMGHANYGGSMTLGVNSEGMLMSINLFLRLGHPPLFIRWEDLDAKIERYFWIERVVFSFKKFPGIRFAISKGLAMKMKDEPGARLLAGLFQISNQEKS